MKENNIEISPVVNSDCKPELSPDGQTVTLSGSNIVTQLHSQTHYQTPEHFVPLEVLNLSFNQAYVLQFLIKNEKGITSYRAISERTQVGRPSVREALSRLHIKGFVLKPVTVKSAVFQGFSYILNKTLCDHFINAGGLTQDRYRHHQTHPQTVSQPDGLRVHSSKFFEDLKETTTSLSQTVIPSDSTTKQADCTMVGQTENVALTSEGFVLTGAVGAYWSEEGLGEGQALKWCQEFDVEPNQMKQQLEWARFDLEANGRRNEIKKNIVSWFFGHLRKTSGCFPRPVNYKSPVEIRAEAFLQQQAIENAAQATIEAAEFDNKFQTFIADPAAFIYQKLLEQISNFAKEQMENGDSMAADIELRELFKDYCISTIL